MYLLRKFRSFEIESFVNILIFLLNILSLSIVCWYGNLNIRNWSKRSKIFRTYCRIEGPELRVFLRSTVMEWSKMVIQFFQMSLIACSMNLNCCPQIVDSKWFSVVVMYCIWTVVCGVLMWTAIYKPNCLFRTNKVFEIEFKKKIFVYVFKSAIYCDSHKFCLLCVFLFG